MEAACWECFPEKEGGGGKRLLGLLCFRWPFSVPVSVSFVTVAVLVPQPVCTVLGTTGP